MRSSTHGDHLRFEITSPSHGRDLSVSGPMSTAARGEGTIDAIADGARAEHRDPIELQAVRSQGAEYRPVGEISHVSFYDLGRAFVDFRLRERRNPEPYTSPPSGVWRVSDCRTDQPPRACQVPRDRKPKTRQSSLASMFSH